MAHRSLPLCHWLVDYCSLAVFFLPAIFVVGCSESPSAISVPDQAETLGTQDQIQEVAKPSEPSELPSKSDPNPPLGSTANLSSEHELNSNEVSSIPNSRIDTWDGAKEPEVITEKRRVAQLEIEALNEAFQNHVTTSADILAKHRSQQEQETQRILASFTTTERGTQTEQNLQPSQKRALESGEASEKIRTLTRLGVRNDITELSDYLSKLLDSEKYPPVQKVLYRTMGKTKDPGLIKPLISHAQRWEKAKNDRYPGVKTSDRKTYDAYHEAAIGQINDSITALLREAPFVETTWTIRESLSDLVANGTPEHKLLATPILTSWMMIDAARNGFAATDFIRSQLQRFHTDSDLSKLITDALVQSLKSGCHRSGYSGFAVPYDVLTKQDTNNDKRPVLTDASLDAVTIALSYGASKPSLDVLQRAKSVRELGPQMAKKTQDATLLLLEGSGHLDADPKLLEIFAAFAVGDSSPEVRNAALQSAQTMLKRGVAQDGIDFYPFMAPDIKFKGPLLEATNTALAIISPLPNEAEEWLTERDFLRGVPGLGKIRLKSPGSQQTPTQVNSTVFQVVSPIMLLFEGTYEGREQMHALVGFGLDDLVDGARFNVVACQYGTFTYKTLVGSKTVYRWIPADIVLKPLSFAEYIRLKTNADVY
jgi:hypothetical protein